MDVLSFEILCTMAEDVDGRYSGLAFDGCFFYLTLPSRNEIHMFDMCCQKIDCLQTTRGYEALCYDSRSHCFWATPSCGQCVYKLDRRCTEIDCIQVMSEDPFAVLTGISCMSDPDDLLIATAGWIALTPKTSTQKATILREFDGAIRVGVADLCDRAYYLVCGMYGDTITTVGRGQERMYALPAEYRAGAIAAGENGTLYVLAGKHCRYPCIIKCSPIGCPKPCPIDCRRGAGEIIKSIASIEVSLSHILNTEGEKLQKALECSDDIGALLKINESIRETIIGVTHMEHVLYDKLRLAESLCRTPNPRPCKRCQNEM